MRVAGAALAASGATDRTFEFRRACAMLAAAALALVAMPITRAAAFAPAPSTTRTIVIAVPGQEVAAARDVLRVGGKVGARLELIHGFTAQLPANAIPVLAAMAEVESVTPDRSLHLLSSNFDPTSDVGSAYNTTLMTGAQDYWKAGYTGRGVDVALIDSGVVRVNGLSADGKVVNGPDLSPESQFTNLAHLDTYGHGTHMAGLIVGRDNAARPAGYAGDSADFLGMAPDSRVVSVKVADAVGATDVSQVIAALDWVVQHRHDHGLNIRVVNLSFGTDSDQSYTVDPLAYAAEVAWNAGIVVVAAAGNSGWRTDGLNDPAYDPRLLSVGAEDTNGSLSPAKHTIATFSNGGSEDRRADLYAPGVHVVSLRDPGSFVDGRFGATGRVGQRFFRGSGTSQATAIVSGAAALVIQQHPTASPDQVKQLLIRSSDHFTADDPETSQGQGQLNLHRALTQHTSDEEQDRPDPSTGTGSLEAARGTTHVVKKGAPLTGEQDIFGRHVNTTVLAHQEADQASWAGGIWNGSAWTGSSWDGSSWDTVAWTASAWTGSSWDGSSWDGSSWDGSSWDGSSWDGSSWDGSSSWSVASWS